MEGGRTKRICQKWEYEEEEEAVDEEAEKVDEDEVV